MAKYKVGDKVVVRSDLDEDTEYYMDDKCDYWYAHPSMMEYAGKVVTILESDATYYYVKETGEDCSWSCEMFSGLTKDVETPKATEPSPTHDKLEIGCRVKAIKNVGWGPLPTVGVCGTIVECKEDTNEYLVNFDTEINGHSGDGMCKENCGWWCDCSKLELISKTPAPVENDVTTTNIDPYANACYYCRKGGLVDRYMKDIPYVCPACGRVSGHTTNTISVAVPKEPTPAFNKPLTNDELRALPDGTRVFTVVVIGGVEQFKERRTCWRTKRGGKLKRKNGHCLISGCNTNNYTTHHAYLVKPDLAVDSGE